MSPIVVEPHPDVLYFLFVQGLLSFAATALLGGLTLIIWVFTKPEARKKLLATVIIGAVAALWGVFEGVWSFTVATPTLRLDGDQLTVGDKTVTLDADTTLTTPGTAKPQPALERDPGYFRFPGSTGFPPFFTGGLKLFVRTKTGDVGFQPLVYGPVGYLDNRGSAELNKLLDVLAAKAKPSEAHAWVKSMVVPPFERAPVAPPSRTGFLIVFLLFMIPTVGGLGYLLVRRKPPTSAKVEVGLP
jgi:hypothetical protein